MQNVSVNGVGMQKQQKMDFIALAPCPTDLLACSMSACVNKLIYCQFFNLICNSSIFQKSYIHLILLIKLLFKKNGSLIVFIKFVSHEQVY